MRQETMTVSPWLEASIAKYGWVWIGLTFGFFAKYALLIKKGVKLRAAVVAADILLLPMVALISYWIIQQAGVRGEGAALLTAGATVGADRLVKLYTDRFMRGVDAMMMEESRRRTGILREEVQAELSAQRNFIDIAEGKRPFGGE